MNNSILKLSFKAKKQSKGKNSYIYCRVRYAGEDATDFSTFLKHSDKWDQESQMFVGSDPDSKEANERLSEISDDLKLLLKEMKRVGEPNVYDLRNKYVKQAERKTLLEIYADHWKSVLKCLGTPGFTVGTKKAHKSLHNIIKSFLTFQKRSDIELINIRPNFGKEFVEWLRGNRRYKQNYIVRNLNHLKRLLNQAKKDGFISENPLINNSEPKEQPGEILYLSQTEINTLIETDLFNKHLQRVADAFVFQCFTGLAYCDLKRFDPDKHVIELHGRQIIQFSRQKGQAPFTIPYLPQAQIIVQKYQGNLPVISNQKMNDYLKDIARTVGINKRLTTHVGRKTAGTYLLNNDVPLEVVSKILGHKSVTTTERIYAVMLQETILRKTAHLCAA